MENKVTLTEYLEKHYAGQVAIDVRPQPDKKSQYTELTVQPGTLKELAEFLKSLGFAFLADVTAVDGKDHFRMVYQLFSFLRDEHICLKVPLEDYQNPQVDSLAGLWKTADWHEREVYDLMGITFIGHPNLKRILMWEGYQEHPLRKSFPHKVRKKNWEV